MSIRTAEYLCNIAHHGHPRFAIGLAFPVVVSMPSSTPPVWNAFGRSLQSNGEATMLPKLQHRLLMQLISIRLLEHFRYVISTCLRIDASLCRIIVTLSMGLGVQTYGRRDRYPAVSFDMPGRCQATNHDSSLSLPQSRRLQQLFAIFLRSVGLHCRFPCNGCFSRFVNLNASYAGMQ